MKLYLSEEKNNEFIKKQFEERVRLSDNLLTKIHSIPSLTDFYYIKRDTTVIDGLDLPPELIDIMEKITNPNPYEVRVFSISTPSNIPVAYVADGEYEIFHVDDYLNTKRVSGIILA